MNYELAKQLKEAGFPMKYSFDNVLYTHPTLEELIEACPKRFEIKEMSFDGDFTLSVSRSVWHVGYEHMDGWFEGEQAEGSTPTIAVAKLWLALNKK